MKHGYRFYIVSLAVALVLLMSLNLLTGSVRIPSSDVWSILTGGVTGHEAWRYIVLESRLPATLSALLTGGALGVCGLMLQTAFHNPLAGPSVFGINSGASLGVAIVMLLTGGTLNMASFSVGGFMATLLAAFMGAMGVTAVIWIFSTLVRNNVLLIIVGMMIGYIASSAITLLNFFATEEGVHSYMVWGLGDFGGVSMQTMPAFAAVVLTGLAAAFSQVKPLNALLLGEAYAENLGVNLKATRNRLLLTVGLLTAITTAFCGPVAFIGLAIPHIARLLLRTDNHRLLMPATLLTGATVALLCQLVCHLPRHGGVIPLNAVTSLIGAPVVIYVILKSGKK